MTDYGITLYQATAEDLMAFIGPLWKPIESDAVTCERCQRQTEEIGDYGYCSDCCEAWCAHRDCECFAEAPEA